MFQSVLRSTSSSDSRYTGPVPIHDVFRATVVAKIMYCAPAWLGMCSAANRTLLSSLLRRAKRLNYCTDDLPPIAELFSNADDDFFHIIILTPTVTTFCSRTYLTIINYHIS